MLWLHSHVFNYCVIRVVLQNHYSLVRDTYCKVLLNTRRICHHIQINFAMLRTFTLVIQSCVRLYKHLTTSPASLPGAVLSVEICHRVSSLDSDATVRITWIDTAHPCTCCTLHKKLLCQPQQWRFAVCYWGTQTRLPNPQPIPAANGNVTWVLKCIASFAECIPANLGLPSEMSTNLTTSKWYQFA